LTIVARGTIGDRPFGRTFYAIAARGFTGDLVIDHAGKRFAVGWYHGAVVAATSPLPADAVARIALTAQLVTSTQVADILRASAPGKDDVDVVAEVAQLSPDQTERLRRRAVGQRAMRLFALDAGDLVLDDEPQLTQHPDLGIDARALIYAGVKAHFTDKRLDSELAGLGTAFRLREAAINVLAQYGFGEHEKPALARLRQEPLTAELLERLMPTIEPKVLRAMLYTLAVTGAVELSEQTPYPAAATPHAALEAALEAPSPESSTRRRSSTSPNLRASRGTAAPPPAAAPTRSVDAAAIKALIRERLDKLDRGADHFALLGVAASATGEQIRAVYFDLARQLHPDRLTAAGVVEEARDAQRLFAQINGAFAVLSNPRRRHDYEKLQAQGGAGAVRAKEEAAEAEAMKLLDAEESFRKGEMALRRGQLEAAVHEFTRAVELNPAEGEHHALWAWASWCASEDKAKVAVPAKRALDKAIELAPKSATPHLYLGRIARHAGRDAEAIAHFQRAVSLSPGHTEASSELRILEQRQNQSGPDDKGKGGLFSRFRRT
jgi:curved DNA-binding protein CbpA